MLLRVITPSPKPHHGVMSNRFQRGKRMTGNLRQNCAGLLRLPPPLERVIRLS